MRSEHYDFYARNSSRLARFASIAGFAFLATIALSIVISMSNVSSGNETLQMAGESLQGGAFENSALKSQ